MNSMIFKVSILAGTLSDDDLERARAYMERLEAELESLRPAARMKLYAKIKKSSKYFRQNPDPDDPRYGGFPFEVGIDPDYLRGAKADFDDYCVKGGPGGQYRLADVNLFMKRSDGVPVKIR